MKVQHIDIFHCQKCGELIYKEHDASPPACCGVQMTRAVTHIPSEIEDDRTASWRDSREIDDPESVSGGRRFPAK